MKWLKRIYECFNAYKLWFLIAISTNLFFSFLAWLVYPEAFKALIGLMIAFTLGVIILPIFIIIRKEAMIEAAFEDFLLEPNETNEEILCRVASKTHLQYIRRIGSSIRAYQCRLNDQVMELTEYENYIEGWVHEIKKPLSLMTLVLDNRCEEMSHLVRRRMVHVRDEIHGDVERILYFARLGAVHKDYIFDPISLLAFCRDAVEKHQTLLEESNFQIQYIGEEKEILSDRKGLNFILEQIIFNCGKYAAQGKDSPTIKFEVYEDRPSDNIILTISDNGPGVASEDLPFIFDKGFTGRSGTYTRQATGMGLFLVSRMAHDLGIRLDVKSELGAGLSILLIFPKVNMKAIN